MYIRKHLCFSIMTASILMLSGCHKNDQPGQLIVKINQNYVTGTYEGDYSGNRPFGHGILTASSSSDGIIQYDGNWVNGKPNGVGTIEYETGNKMTGVFADGYMEGEFTEICKDNSYSKLTMQNGKPVGRIDYYSPADIHNGYDFYFNGEKIQDIRNEMVHIPYERILSNPLGYKGSYKEISGTVIAVTETPETVYLQITDSKNLHYVFSCNNSEVKDKIQGLLPNNIKKGDHITALGQIYDCTNTIYDNRQEVLKFDYTTMLLRLVQLQEENESNHLDFTFDELSNYPFCYYGSFVDVDAVVTGINIDYSENLLYYEVQTKDGNSLVLKKNYAKNMKLIWYGNNIEVKGICSGNFKTQRTVSGKIYYEKIPLVIADDYVESESSENE